MNAVCWIGPHFFPTGYGEAARSHAKALARAGVPVVARHNQPLNPGLQNEYISDDHEINELILPPEGRPAVPEPDVFVWHVTPDAAQQVKDKKNLVCAAWEVEGLPHGWADAVNQMDGLLTPSEFSARLFREGGVKVPIGVCPHPIDLDRFHPQVNGSEWRQAMEKEAGRPLDTIFLVVSQWMFRKGIEDVMYAYLTEFKPDEKVGLALLTWRWSHVYQERLAVRKYIDFIKAGLNLGNEFPPVLYIGRKVPPSELPKVYAASDVFLQPSRGEAFSIPVFEAAATAKPIISNGYGGQFDYLTDESAWRLPYQLETLVGAGLKWRHYGGHQRWGRPSIDDIRKTMREAHEDKELRLKKGQVAFDIVAENLSFPKAGARMKAEIERILSIDMGQEKR